MVVPNDAPVPRTSMVTTAYPCDTHHSCCQVGGWPCMARQYRVGLNMVGILVPAGSDLGRKISTAIRVPSLIGTYCDRRFAVPHGRVVRPASHRPKGPPSWAWSMAGV